MPVHFPNVKGGAYPFHVEHEDSNTPADAGGADATGPIEGGIEPKSIKDQAMMRRFMTRHPVAWRSIDDRKMAKWAAQLEDAGDEAHAQMTSATDEGQRLEAAKALTSVVKTGIMASRVQQVERLKREEWDRLDAGKLTGRTAHEHSGGLMLAHLIEKAKTPEEAKAIEEAFIAAQQGQESSGDGPTRQPPA